MATKSRSKTKPRNPGFKQRLDLIELSDAFRRNAAFDNPRAVGALVEEARNFATISTFYNPSERKQHKDICEKLNQSARNIVALAHNLGVDEVDLPVSGDRHSPFARFFNRKVLPGLASLPVKVSLQQKEYATDLTDLGPIDHKVKTALDDGVRNVADIADHLKQNRWGVC